MCTAGFHSCKEAHVQEFCAAATPWQRVKIYTDTQDQIYKVSYRYARSVSEEKQPAGLQQQHR